MSSLRPNSVCDTTPLQGLESQSSCSESSSPTLNGMCVGAESNAVGSGSSSPSTGATGTGTPISTPTSTSTTLSLANHNNNKIEIHLSNFVNAASDKRKMDSLGTGNIFTRIFMDLIMLGCVGLPILGFHLWGESYKRGFFCDDDSLKHPLKPSTIRSWMLYLMGLVVPVTLIVSVEFFKANSNKMRGFGNLSQARYYFCHLEIPEWITECYTKIGVLVFGAGVVELTTDIAKYSIGRLRPHFFAVCQPLMSDGTSCDDGINVGRYIEEFTCRGEDVTPRMLKEVRLSFPSGHATFTFYTMIYVAIYLQRRMTWHRAKMFKHLLQFLLLMFAWYTALTRVSDYKHHWTDVLAGSGIGVLYAIVATSTMW